MAVPVDSFRGARALTSPAGSVDSGARKEHSSTFIAREARAKCFVASRRRHRAKRCRDAGEVPGLEARELVDEPRGTRECA